MRVLVAPQEFKGTLTAREAAEAISRGVASARPGWALGVAPVADGGPGTLDALISAGQVQPHEAEVEDPLGRRVRAILGLGSDGGAFVEMAQASGLWRVASGERDALSASTFGTGQLIRAALDQGATSIELGAGGSATTDGGTGALRALGIELRDDAGRPLPRGGGALERLASIDVSGLDPRVSTVPLRVWVDVQNPLTGLDGAARIYAPQKGANPEQVDRLERGLVRFAQVTARTTGLDLSATPGCGAAGGLAFGLLAFAGARIVPGFEALSRVLRLDDRLREADVVITGEGRLDVQTGFGKGPAALARRARSLGRRAVCFAGQVARDASSATAEFDEVIATSRGGAVPSREEAAAQLEEAARAWATAFSSGANR